MYVAIIADVRQVVLAIKDAFTILPNPLTSCFRGGSYHMIVHPLVELL